MGISKRYEATLVGILFFTWGTVFLDRMSPLYLAPYLAPELHLSSQQISLLASALAITWALGGLFLAALSDRLGRRRVLIPALFVFAVLSALSGQARSFGQLLLIRALVGVVAGPAWSIIATVIEESSDHSRRGRNVGIVVSAAALVGLAFAPVLATQVAAHYGWRLAFLVPGGLGLIMASLVMKYVKEPRELGIAPAHQQPSAADYFSLLRYRNIWLACLGSTAFMTWLYMQNIFAPLFITEVMHQPGTTAGFLLGATGLGSFFLGFAFPALSDRIGRKATLIILALVSSVVPAALQYQPLYGHMLLLGAILFLTNGGQAIGSLVVVLIPAESVPPQVAGTAIGLSTLVGEIVGGTISPAVAGRMAELHGLDFPLMMAAGAMGVLLLAALFLKGNPSAGVSREGPSAIEGAGG
jgi:predicted MFS family arabinose efflux permease